MYGLTKRISNGYYLFANAEGGSALLVARPRQGTIMRWPLAGDAVKNLVNGAKAPAVLESLNTMQQETMCAEWLRSPHVVDRVDIPRLSHLLLPIGRTMEDLDIVGMASNGTRIFGQVTFARRQSSTATDKARNLQRHHAPDVKLIMFCRFEGGIDQDGDVLYIPAGARLDGFYRHRNRRPLAKPFAVSEAREDR